MQAADPRRLGRPSGRAFVWRHRTVPPIERRRTDGAGRLVITSSFAASVGPDLTDGAGGSLWAPPIVGTDDPGILGLTAHACEAPAVRFLYPEQQHSFSLPWYFLQPLPARLVAVGQYAPQPACCNPRPCANSEFSFGPKGYSPRGGGTPLRVRGNVPLDSMHPTLMHLLC